MGVVMEHKAMRGDGWVYKRKDSRCFWVGYYLNGRPYQESSGKQDEKDARKFLRNRLKEVHAAQIGAKPFVGPAGERVTVNDLLDTLEANYKLRGKFRPPVESHFKLLRRELGKRRAKSLTDDVLMQWLSKLKESCAILGRLKNKARHVCTDKCPRLKPATINRYTQILRQAFILGRKRIGEVPEILKLPEENVRQGFFEYEEFMQVHKHLPDDLKDYAHFDFLCGWRKGEVAKLAWDMIEIQSRMLHLPAEFSKNGEPRKIPLQGKLWEIIQRRKKARTIRMPTGEVLIAPLVFFRKHGRGIPDPWAAIKEFRKSWKTACTNAGVPKKLFHDLRRTAVRNLIRAGVDTKVAMLITGHKSESVFQRYNITSEADIRDAVAKVENYIGKLENQPQEALNDGE
jgi:integrase